MNLIVIDIGNSMIKVAFYLDDSEKLLKTVNGGAEDIRRQLADVLAECWDQIPLVKSAKEPVKEGALVASSVKPEWTDLVREVVRDTLGQELLVIGQEVPLPMETAVDSALTVGTDRLCAAAAAYAVVEGPVVVADFGTAVTVDLVDEEGVFVGGTISPGFNLALDALNQRTARLPKVEMQKPKKKKNYKK